jgi:hypothetical protein
MVRHDRIGDVRAVLAKSVGVGIVAPVYSSTVTAGDHEYLTLVLQHYSQTGTKDYTVTLEESADNVTFTAIPGGSLTRTGSGVPENGEDLIVLDRRKAGRYVRAKFTATTAFSVSAVWLLEGDKNKSLTTRANVLVV